MQKTIDDVLLLLGKQQGFVEDKFSHIPIFTDQHYFFAVSGGVDSMTLASCGIYYLKNQGIKNQYIHILHYNHKQRDESSCEEEGVIKYFQGYDIFVGHFDGDKNQTENSLRKARRNFIESKLVKYPGSYLFLGHHLEDKIETIMLHMQRGCGIRGVTAMPMTHKIIKFDGRNYIISRPFLFITKSEIYAMAKKVCIPYREDVTNFESSISQRNALRKEFSTDLSDFPIHLFAEETKSNEFLFRHLEYTISSVFSSCFRIHRDYYNNLQDIRDLLDFCDIYKNCSESRMREIEKIVFSQKGCSIYFAGWYFRKQGKYLYMIASRRYGKEENSVLRSTIKKLSNNYATKIGQIFYNFIQ